MRLYPLAALCAVAALSATPALAASPGDASPGAAPPASASKSTAPDITNMQQSLKQDLTKAGFKDITISPASFNVHATNSSGQKVYMLVGPESLTELVSAPAPHAEQSNSAKNTASK